MKINNFLRASVFKILRSKNIDDLRYLKFVFKLKKFSKYKNKKILSKDFSKFYEPEMVLIPRILKNRNNVFIDVGANYGIFSFFLSKIGNGETKIYAFEPVTRTFKIMKKILRKFKLNNVIPVKLGLGNKEESKEICLPSQYTILAHIVEKNRKKSPRDEFETIKVTTLDNFVKKYNLKNIDFIKCDVEGFELEVFKGAINSLKKYKPIIFVEVEERHTKKYGINPSEVIDFFKKINYVCYGANGSKLFESEKIVPEVPIYFFIPKNYFPPL